MGDSNRDSVAHAVDLPQQSRIGGAEHPGSLDAGVRKSIEMAKTPLRPEVDKPRPRVRIGLLVALLVTIAMGVATILYQLAAPTSPTDRTPPTPSSAAHCTPLDAEQQSRTMANDERVTCFAVAGKIDRARQVLRAMAPEDQARAIAAVFAVAHPIADSGDDRSAGPIMELVAEFSPANYMAVFHAGMAEFALGQDDAARIQLQRFLAMYDSADVWRERAVRALAAIDARVPLDQREAHFPE